MVEAKRELTRDPIVHRIIALLSEQGKTDKELLEYLGMGRNTFVSWKYGRIKSYQAHINEIAEFLDVSPNYLLRGVDDEINVETMSDTELQLIKSYRAADREGQKHIIDMVKYIEMATKNNNKKERRTG